MPARAVEAERRRRADTRRRERHTRPDAALPPHPFSAKDAPPRHPSLTSQATPLSALRLRISRYRTAATSRHRVYAPLDRFIQHPSHPSESPETARPLLHPQKTQEATTARRHAARHQQARENQTFASSDFARPDLGSILVEGYVHGNEHIRLCSQALKTLAALACP